MAQQVITIPFSGQLIGQGYNTETGESVGTALEFDAVFEDTSTDAQTASTMFESVETQDSLKESLGISASGDVRVGLFAGSAKMNFAEGHSVNSSSSYVAGRSFVQNAIRHGKGFRLTKEAHALVTSNNMDDFKKAFGDRFVRSLATGGEFCLIARITSSSEDHQSELSAALHAEYNGLINSGSFSAAFDTATAETSGKTEVSVKMLQSGGQGDELSFTGPRATDIIERLKKLPAFVHEHASGIEAELATYDTIPIPVLSAEQREDQKLVLIDCANQKTLFLRAISDLQLMLDDSGKSLFEGLPPAVQLTTMLGQYRATLNALLAHAIKVSIGTMDPPQLFVPTPPPPPVDFKRVISKELSSVLVAKGEAIANQDPLAALLRDQPGRSKLGFLTGLGAAGNDTLPGPWKDEKRDAMALGDRDSFQQAVDYSIDKNSNPDAAARGAAIVKADQAVANERAKLPLSVAWLGFDIATGIFGRASEGAFGNTAEGSGSDKIFRNLCVDGKKGYKAGVMFNLGRPKQ
jgi:hypothetical protein